MDTKNIILRLKRSNYKSIEASSIKRELRQLPTFERKEVLNKLREEKSRSDNSDIIDVINDIIDELSPQK